MLQLKNAHPSQKKITAGILFLAKPQTHKKGQIERLRNFGIARSFSRSHAQIHKSHASSNECLRLRQTTPFNLYVLRTRGTLELIKGATLQNNLSNII